MSLINRLAGIFHSPDKKDYNEMNVPNKWGPESISVEGEGRRSAYPGDVTPPSLSSTGVKSLGVQDRRQIRERASMQGLSGHSKVTIDKEKSTIHLPSASEQVKKRGVLNGIRNKLKR